MREALRLHPVTLALIAWNILFFGIAALQPNPFSAESLVELGATYGWRIGVHGEWWRIVTGTFLHAGITHIALNMLSLYLVGKVTETLLGRWEYLGLYLTSGIVGATVSTAIHPEGLTVGASGAIFGIFGAVAGYALTHRRHLGDRFGRFLREFGGILLLNLLLGFAIPGIDMSAHIGGLIVGFIGGMFSRHPHAVLLWSAFTTAAAAGYVMWIFPAQFATQGAIG